MLSLSFLYDLICLGNVSHNNHLLYEAILDQRLKVCNIFHNVCKYAVFAPKSVLYLPQDIVLKKKTYIQMLILSPG